MGRDKMRRPLVLEVISDDASHAQYDHVASQTKGVGAIQTSKSLTTVARGLLWIALAGLAIGNVVPVASGEVRQTARVNRVLLISLADISAFDAAELPKTYQWFIANGTIFTRAVSATNGANLSREQLVSGGDARFMLKGQSGSLVDELASAGFETSLIGDSPTSPGAPLADYTDYSVVDLQRGGLARDFSVVRNGTHGAELEQVEATYMLDYFFDIAYSQIEGFSEDHKWLVDFRPPVPRTRLDRVGAAPYLVPRQLPDGVDPTALARGYDAVLYDKMRSAALGDLDAALATLLQWVRIAWGPDSLIVLSSDGGAAGVNQRGIAMPPDLTQSALKVPLMVSGPGFAEGQLSYASVTNGDVAATIVQSAFGRVGACTEESPGQGCALQEAAKAATTSHRSIVSVVRTSRGYDFAVFFDHYKLIRRAGGATRLVDLSVDAYELDNLLTHPGPDGDFARELAGRMKAPIADLLSLEP